MLEAGEYSYQVFRRDNNLPIDLGDYKKAVLPLFATLNLIGDYPADDLLAEFDDHLVNYWLVVILALNRDSNVVAYSALAGILGDEELDLDEAYVDKEYRRKGIYKEMLTRRIEAAGTMGARCLNLMPDANAVQVRYLESQGFTEYYDGDNRIYKKYI